MSGKKKNKREAAQLLGASKSRSKAESSSANGKLGGRPRLKCKTCKKMLGECICYCEKPNARLE